MTKDNPRFVGNAGHRARTQDRFLALTDVSVLADYEILELLLMKAVPRVDVKPLAKKLVNHFGSLGEVLQADPTELQSFPGIGKSALVLFKLVRESGRRMLGNQMKRRPVLSAWESLLDYCFLHIQHEPIEKFLILYLDVRAQLIRSDIVQVGTINRVAIYPREVLKSALVLGAEAVVIAHNHPSGDVQPSPADVVATHDLFQTLTAAHIRLIDHIIVGPDRQMYSFYAHGNLSARVGEKV